ncbi:MAG: hypothetical protein JXA97_00850 [Anaerolineales bacterium]|nr:hypothetical protein [Anaerolineales bacterium]
MRSQWVMFGVLLLAAALSACGGPPAPTCTAANLVAPTLTLPADGGFLELGQNLDWEYPASPCEPGGWNLQVNTASDFSGTEVGGFVPPPHSWWWPPMPLAQGTTYYWRVQAVLDGGAGPWSPTWTFNTKPPCDLADLVAPIQIFPDDQTEYGYPIPSFVWDYSDPVCDPLGYHLQIADIAGFDFTSIAYESRSPDPTTSDDFAGSTLSDCTVYYWRVAAYDGTTDGPWSPTRTFRLNLNGTCPALTCAEADLVSPQHVWPTGYEIISTLNPYLEWVFPGLCQPEGYLVYVSSRYNMSDIVYAGGTTDPSSTTSPTNPLEPAMQYWWEVIPGVGPTLGPSSGVSSFFTGPECTSSSMLGAPELLYPPDSAQIHEEYVVLEFAANVFGCIPDGYMVDVQTDPNFGGYSLLGTYSTPDTRIYTWPFPQDCTTYYWRVAAVQDGVMGPFSVTRTFFMNHAGNCAQSAVPDLHLEALRDLACYERPSFEAVILGYFLTGETTLLFAQDLMGEWWVVENPDSIGTLCWVPQDGTEPSGDAGELPRWEEPADPLVCNINMNRTDCEAAGGTYIDTVTRAPYCQCP